MVEQLEKLDLYGQVVISKCGRDKGKYYVIIGFDDSDQVLVCDGRLKKVEKPKKKNMKHLKFTESGIAEVREDLCGGKKLVDAHVRRAIQEWRASQGVWQGRDGLEDVQR